MVPLAGFAIVIDALVVILSASTSGPGVHNIRVVKQPMAITAEPSARDYFFGINI